MFKNKAIYIEAVEKKTMPQYSNLTPAQHNRLIEDVIHQVISESGEQVVKGVIIMMSAYFTLKTISVVIENLTKS